MSTTESGPAVVAKRLGWLLGAWRRTHPKHQDPAVFLATLADVLAERSGGHADLECGPDQLAAWESGREAPPYDVVRAAEVVLGQQPGELAHLPAYLFIYHRMPVPAWTRPRLAPGTQEFVERRAALVETVLESNPALQEWWELGHHLTADPDVELAPETWEGLCRAAIAVLPRGVRAAHRTITQAAHALCDVPAAQPAMARSIAAYLADPDVQVASLPIGMLERIPSREAGDLVLDLLEAGFSLRDSRLAIWVAAQKLRRGDLDDDQRTRLDLMLLGRWRSNSRATAANYAELISELPDSLREAFGEAARQVGRGEVATALTTGERMPASMARDVSAAISDKIMLLSCGFSDEGRTEDREMLTQLCREAMFDLRSDRRHVASVVLSASPFAGAITSCALDLLDRDDVPDVLRAHAAQLVQYAAGEENRMRLHHYLDDPNEAVTFPAVHALGHLPFSKVSDLELRRGMPAEDCLLGRSRMYALGMTGSPALGVLASGRAVPQWQAAAARWWLASGPSLQR
ncbi:MAG: hypothetical protein Q8Q02_01805 [Nocardioides sp.]|nr:hypothetical protein [Nocardioides sp.]